MKNTDQLKSLVNQLQVVVTTVKNDTSINKMDLRRVLTFINKVIMVVDQAFQNVLVVFDNVRYLKDHGSNEEYDHIQKEIQALSARDRYRDVELICGRLSVLKECYMLIITRMPPPILSKRLPPKSTINHSFSKVSSDSPVVIWLSVFLGRPLLTGFASSILYKS